MFGVINLLAWAVVAAVVYFVIVKPLRVYRHLGYMPERCDECDRPLGSRYYIVPGGNGEVPFDEVRLGRMTPALAVSADVVCNDCYGEYQKEKEMWLTKTGPYKENENES